MSEGVIKMNSYIPPDRRGIPPPPTEEQSEPSLFDRVRASARLSLGDFRSIDAFDADLLMPQAVWDGIGREGTLMLIAGESKSFKSWFALEIVQHAVLEKSLLGRAMKRPSTRQPRRALILDFELLKMNLVSRFIALSGKHGDDRDELFSDRVIVECHRENMMEPVEWVDYCCQRIVEEMSAGDVVVVDCLQPIVSFDSNAASETRRMMAKFQAAATKTGALVVLIDHFSKSSEARGANRVSGSMAKIAAPDEILLMEASGQFIDLRPILRLDRSMDEIGMEFAEGYRFAVVDPDDREERSRQAKAAQMRENVAKAFPSIGQRLTKKEAAANFGITDRRLDDHLPEWEAAGLIEADRSNKTHLFWRLP